MLSWVSFSGHVAKQQRQRSAKALDVGATPTMASRKDPPQNTYMRIFVMTTKLI